MNYWASVMRAIKESDIILFMLDARMPELSRNRDLEKKLEESGKEFLIVFNKIDLVSKETLDKLSRENSGAFFVSSSKNIGIGKLRLALQMRTKKSGYERLEIGIVGYPNVGKSALTNILSRSAKTQVSSKAGTTTGNQWASSNQFKIVDSPGVIPFEDDEAKLGVLGAKNPEKLKNPEAVACEVIKIFLGGSRERLEAFYDFEIEGDDAYEILMQIGIAKKLLKKGGVVEENRAAMMVIRDWQGGKLRL
jgi:ribosome biogenesis GTPase A